MQLLETFFLLLFGHALADFVLQPEAMDQGKNRNAAIHSNEQSLFPHWSYWLAAHSLIHGGIVFLITGNVVLGLIEAIAHWLTDYYKCEGTISMHQDQSIHIACKVGYLFFI
ncbi:MAG: DUF3307 domain-containing protein [Gammaproteobacteria bacterium]|nr:DUF3307 domain-containing protein [Gammaproteobacteria bacterium]